MTERKREAQRLAEKSQETSLERRVAALELLVVQLRKEDARLAEVICRVDKEVVSLELDVRGTAPRDPMPTPAETRAKDWVPEIDFGRDRSS